MDIGKLRGDKAIRKYCLELAIKAGKTNKQDIITFAAFFEYYIENGLVDVHALKKFFSELRDEFDIPATNKISNNSHILFEFDPNSPIFGEIQSDK